MLPASSSTMKRCMARLSYGLKDDQIPLLARVIGRKLILSMPDYQPPVPARTYSGRSTAHHPHLAGKRLDPKAVDAITAVYGRGEIRISASPVRNAVQSAPVNAAADAFHAAGGNSGRGTAAASRRS